MFISAGSTQSSLWGWNGRVLDSTGFPAQTGDFGNVSSLTLAPNGFLYAIPSGASTTQVLKVDPKTTNGKNSNYQKSLGTLLTSPSSPAFSGLTAYASKGILAPNGKIYFIPVRSSAAEAKVCIFDPGDSTGNNVSWDFFLLPSGILGSQTNRGFFAGAVLGKDGKIYLIPNSSNAIVRLDVMTGPTPIVEYSYYDGTGTGGVLTLIGNCNSAGDVITFSASTGGVSSITSAVVGRKVNPYYAGVDAILPAGFPKPFMFPRTGLLNPDQDTIVTEYLSPTSFRINPAPSIPLVNDGLVILKPQKSLLGGTSTTRLLGFLDKFSAGRGELTTNNPVYSYDRYTNFGVGGSSQSVINQTFCGGALDPTPGSNKIFLLPGPGAQVFYIDPTNWNNENVLSTAKNLSFATFGYTTLSGNKWLKFASISAGSDGNLYIYPFDNLGSTAISRIFKLNPQTLTLSIVPTNTVTPTVYTTPANLYAVATLPNGYLYSRDRIAGTVVYTNTDSNKTVTYIDPKIPSNTQGLVSGTNSLDPSFGVIQYTGSFSILSSADDKCGKVIFDGKTTYYGSDFISVKGFYNGVTNFSPMDSDSLNIPSNLANLPTSKYNIYANRFK